jgi:hypothetical protein
MLIMALHKIGVIRREWKDAEKLTKINETIQMIYIPKLQIRASCL